MIRVALTCILVALVPAIARPEPVTYVLSGVLTEVTDGTSGTRDLTGIFHVGQAFVVHCEVERGATSFPEGTSQVTYGSPVTDLSIVVASFVAAGAGSSIASVQNDHPDQPSNWDQLAVQAGPLVAPLGDGYLQSFLFVLRDLDATVFDTMELPLLLPPANEFEVTSVVLSFVDPILGNGELTGTVGELATPATATSWGRLRARYRQ
jgi:hypothetical protein